ncbi:HAMP domain-containing protein [candidate division KSB1 bacterium]|nr:HAMP domain-containing protein [candidate division KSB1 bacterium]
MIEQSAKQFHSLTRTLKIAFFLVIAIVMLIFSSFELYFSYQTQQKVIDGQLQLIVKEAAEQVSYYIDDKFKQLETIAYVGGLATAGSESQEMLLEKLLGSEIAFRQIAIRNKNSQKILKVSRLSGLSVSQLAFQKTDEIAAVLATHNRYISPLYFDEVTSEPQVIIAVPVKDVFGDFQGVFMAELNLKFMWDLIETIKIGKHGSVYVVNLQGDLIAFTDISRVLKHENLANLKEIKEFVNGSEQVHHSGAEISRGIINTVVLTTHEHLGMPNWAVVVELPLWEAYETVFTIIIMSIITMVFSFGLAIVVSFYLSKRITKPIIDLRDATKAISKGQLNEIMEAQTQDEIGELTICFNEMVRNLNTTTVSRDSLQREVIERKKYEQ